MVEDLDLRLLDEVDLSPFAVGIGRRCLNPTAALFDALRYPDGDGAGVSLLELSDPQQSLSHVVIGSGPPGGSWDSMSPTTVSLSPGHWMDFFLNHIGCGLVFLLDAGLIVGCQPGHWM